MVRIYQLDCTIIFNVIVLSERIIEIIIIHAYLYFLWDHFILRRIEFTLILLFLSIFKDFIFNSVVLFDFIDAWLIIEGLRGDRPMLLIVSDFIQSMFSPQSENYMGIFVNCKETLSKLFKIFIDKFN